MPRPFILRDAGDLTMERGSGTEDNYDSSRTTSSNQRAKRSR